MEYAVAVQQYIVQLNPTLSLYDIVQYYRDNCHELVILFEMLRCSPLIWYHTQETVSVLETIYLQIPDMSRAARQSLLRLVEAGRVFRASIKSWPQ